MIVLSASLRFFTLFPGGMEISISYFTPLNITYPFGRMAGLKDMVRSPSRTPHWDVRIISYAMLFTHLFGARKLALCAWVKNTLNIE